MGALAAATFAALLPAVADMERAAELGSGGGEDEDAKMQMVSARAEMPSLMYRNEHNSDPASGVNG